MKKKNNFINKYIFVFLFFLTSIIGFIVYSNNNYKKIDSFTPRIINKHYPTIEEVCKEESGSFLQSCSILESNQYVKYKKTGYKINRSVNEFQMIEIWKPISENEWALKEVKYNHKCTSGITSLFWNTAECN